MFEIPRETTRRGWTFPLSMAGELLVVSLLVVIPRTQVQVLTASVSGMISLESPPPPPPPAGPQAPMKTVARRIVPDELMLPVVLRVPNETALVASLESEGAEIPEGVPGGVPGGVAGGVPGGIPGGVPGGIVVPLPVAVPLPAPVAAVPPPAPAPPRRVFTGGDVQSALLVHQVLPLYPRIAREGHVTGIVRLKAIISSDGKVENLTLIGGNPLLVSAAEKAVSQWVYKPTLLNGIPVEVETDISVKFSLQGF